MVEMNMLLSLRVQFTTKQAEEFLRHIEGTGGGQEFVKHCQQALRHQNPRRNDGGDNQWWFLKLEGDDVNKWFRYRDEYGSGGFQSRLGRAPAQESLL